jgi:hypothetical protein
LQGQGQSLGRGQPQAQAGEITGPLTDANGLYLAQAAPSLSEKAIQSWQEMHQERSRGVQGKFAQDLAILKQGQAALVGGRVQS